MQQVKKFLTRFFSFIGVFFLVVMVLVCWLAYGQFTPLLTNSVCFDSKLQQVRDAKIEAVDVLSVGSSMTLNNLSSKIMTAQLNEHLSYYNLGSWGLKVNEMEHVMNIAVPLLNPKIVIVASSVPDFTGTSTQHKINKWMMNAYLKQFPAPCFFLANLNLPLLLSRQLEIDSLSKMNNTSRSLQFDRNGGVELEVPPHLIDQKRWNEKFTFIAEENRNNYTKHLTSIAESLKGKGILLVFVQTPMRKKYVESILAVSQLKAHYSLCRSIVESHNGIYINNNEQVLPDSLFADVTHLNAAGAQVFTKMFLDSLKQRLDPVIISNYFRGKMSF